MLKETYLNIQNIMCSNEITLVLIVCMESAWKLYLIDNLYLINSMKHTTAPLMRPHGHVGGGDDIAGDWHGATQDVEKCDDRGDTPANYTEDDEKVTVDSLPERQTPTTKPLKVSLTVWGQPLYPVFVLTAGVHQLQVEERGEYEGEDGDGGGPDQFQDCTKTGDGLSYEEQDEHGEAPEGASLPVHVWRNVEELLEELSRGVGDDGEGGDEVEEQHHLHHDPLPPLRHGQHDVVRHVVPQGEVTANSHREVYQEQN